MVTGGADSLPLTGKSTRQTRRPSMLGIMKRNVAVVVVTAVVLGAGAVAWAQEAPPDPQTGDPAPTAPAPGPGEGQGEGQGDGERRPGPGRKHRGHHGPAGVLGHRAVHGELIVRAEDGTFEEVTFDRGIVRQQGEGYAIERPDGQTVPVKLTDTTRFRGIEGAEQIRVGEPAIVVSAPNGDAKTFAQK